MSIEICMANGDIITYKDNEYIEYKGDTTGFLIKVNYNEKILYNRNYIQYIKFND